MEKEELRRIGLYRDKLMAAGLNTTVLTDAERFDLSELLKKWLAEVEEEPIIVRFLSSWGDVRKLTERR